VPSRKLTALAIPALPPGEWYDLALPGLILWVGKRRRSWYFRYHANGSYRREPLGSFPAMGLSEARDAARRLIDRADKGIPVEAPAPHPRSGEVLTLGGLIDKYESLRRLEGRKIRTLDEALAMIRRALAPYLSLPAAQFSKANLRAARDAMDGRIAGNRLLQRFGAVMRWGAQEDLIPINFVPDIRRAAEQKRTRRLTESELRKIWIACGDHLGTRAAAGNFGRLVKFLMITGQRLGEAAALRHGHILGGIWRQAENKSDRPHSLRLPPLALSLIGQGGARDFVFAGSFGQISGFSKLKAQLDSVSGVSDWRLHDLRRTAASGMQDLGIRNEIVQSVLNHAVPGVGGVYLRSELEQEKALALAAWANALGKIVGRAAA